MASEAEEWRGRLTDPDRNVRNRAAAIARGWIEASGAGREFAAAALTSPDAELRLLAARHWPAADEVLATALADPEVAVRRAASGRLEGRADGDPERNVPGAFEALLQASGDPDWSVRVNSLRAYWRSGDAPPVGLSAVPAQVVAGLGDPHELVRLAAVGALGSIGGPDAVAPLESALADRVGSVRSAAVVSLLRVAPERGFPVAVAALRGPGRQGHRVEAAGGLGRLGDPRAIEPLSRLLLETTRSAPRIAAAEALRSIRRVAAVPALEAVLASDTTDWNVRSAVVRALARIGRLDGQEAHELFLRTRPG